MKETKKIALEKLESFKSIHGENTPYTPKLIADLKDICNTPNKQKEILSMIAKFNYIRLSKIRDEYIRDCNQFKALPDDQKTHEILDNIILKSETSTKTIEMNLELLKSEIKNIGQKACII